jgi:hypothetical protein
MPIAPATGMPDVFSAPCELNSYALTPPLLSVVPDHAMGYRVENPGPESTCVEAAGAAGAADADPQAATDAAASAVTTRDRSTSVSVWTHCNGPITAGNRPGAGLDRVEDPLALRRVLVVVEDALLLQRVELLQARRRVPLWR